MGKGKGGIEGFERVGLVLACSASVEIAIFELKVRLNSKSGIYYLIGLPDGIEPYPAPNPQNHSDCFQNAP